MGSNARAQKKGVIERISGLGRLGAFLVLCVALVLAQRGYDAERLKAPRDLWTPSLGFVKAFDLGLHAAAASLMWINVRTQLPYFPEGPQKFDSDLGLVNNLDPRFSTPYYFIALTLPFSAKEYPNAVARAVAVGELGVRQADPDWRIPFYVATTYFLYLRDDVNAARYFDIAARTPGIPEIVRRYAVNYGAFTSIREKTMRAWEVISASTEDKETRDRAQAYIAHYQIVDFLDRALSAYVSQYRQFPAQIEDLVTRGIIAEIPKDPFGFEFTIYPESGVGFKAPDN